MSGSLTPAVDRRATLTSGLGGRRTAVDRLMRGLAVACTAICIVPLVAILLYVTVQGIKGLSVDLLTKPPTTLGEGGGAVNSILGTIQMVGLASLLAIPLGVLAGVYLSEYASGRVARTVRFAGDVMVGIPSILIGVFVFTILVLPFGQYNAFAGAVSLAVIMIPVIMRTTEEILVLVPDALREASYALGIRRYRTILTIVIRTGLAGILTGVMLAVARAAGETAPLIMTALGSRLVNVFQWGQPMDAMSLFVYNGSRSPYPAVQEQAWAVAFLLLLFVLVINVIVRARSWGQKMSS
ncbi:MAG TPA: phosphate ABC transporter permease PstA [Candidatus Limnocylindrales bacterium]